VTPTRRAEIESVFEAALERPPDERSTWLAARCGGDDALRAEVSALLSAHRRADGILEADLSRAAAELSPPGLQRRRIGPWRVVRELGRGGMGVVYLAERDDGQFRRRVAIKLLRNSPDAEELHRRFRAERQILASLDHPNIAQLLDGGITDGQLPYLVMEYVEGLPITAYCDRHRLGIPARLALFQAVCAAVHHAHKNLIIHRDLKPSNILVSPAGQVKLLDFGIAKLLNPELSPVDMPVTRTGHRLLTPDYASPEQVRGEPLTTASDVYSLGVVLYELLAGHPPYRLTTYAPGEILEVVCEREPERPSAAVRRREPGALAEGRAGELTPEGIAAARDAAPAQLARRLRGDLDAIVMMALRKEPTRRYGSADLLAADIQRHVESLPVVAHRGSRWYRARKLLHRHRIAAAAAALVATSLVGGAGVALWQGRVAARERDRAEAARVQSEAVTRFLMGLFEASDPLEARGDSVTARDLLRRGVARADALDGEPLVQARLLEVTGLVYRSLGDYALARTQLERSLAARRAARAADDADAARTLSVLADVLRRQGLFVEAERTARRALDIRAGRLGPEHPDVAESLLQLSVLVIYRARLAEAETLSRRALAIRRRILPPNDPVIGENLEQLAAIVRRRGNSPGAEAMLREALGVHLRAADRARATPDGVRQRIGDILMTDYGRLEDAEAMYEAAIADARAAVGETHPRVAWAYGSLGGLRSVQGRHAEAERLVRQALEIHRRAAGPDHPNVAGSMGHLAVVLTRAGRLAEAESLARRVMEMDERRYGRRHQLYLSGLGRVASILARRGRLTEAESLQREALRIRAVEMGDADGPLLAIGMTNLAGILVRRGDLAAADSLLDHALRIHRRLTTNDHIDIRRVFTVRADLLEARGDRRGAARYRELARGAETSQ
jgi:serine/threonine-protein kinase